MIGGAVPNYLYVEPASKRSTELPIFLADPIPHDDVGVVSGTLVDRHGEVLKTDTHVVRRQGHKFCRAVMHPSRSVLVPV